MANSVAATGSLAVALLALRSTATRGQGAAHTKKIRVGYVQGSQGRLGVVGLGVRVLASSIVALALAGRVVVWVLIPILVLDSGQYDVFGVRVNGQVGDRNRRCGVGQNLAVAQVDGQKAPVFDLLHQGQAAGFGQGAIAGFGQSHVVDQRAVGTHDHKRIATLPFHQHGQGAAAEQTAPGRHTAGCG